MEVSGTRRLQRRDAGDLGGSAYGSAGAARVSEGKGEEGRAREVVPDQFDDLARRAAPPVVHVHQQLEPLVVKPPNHHTRMTSARPLSLLEAISTYVDTIALLEQEAEPVLHLLALLLSTEQRPSQPRRPNPLSPVSAWRKNESESESEEEREDARGRGGVGGGRPRDPT